MTTTRWDYLFLLSNEPVPGLVEKIQCAVAAGRRVLVVHLVRPWKALQVGTIEGAEVLPRPVSFDSVGWRRLAAVGANVRWLKRGVLPQLARDGDIYTDALDLLAIAQLAGWGQGRRLRLEVRDLHWLQMGRGVASRTLRAVERALLRRVHTLVLTSDAHYQHYYRELVPFQPTMVENVPARDPWVGFQRRPHEGFVVGFVGVLRYRRSLEALVDAARALHERGVAIEVRFAGGGDVDALRRYAGTAPFVSFSGPFQYRDSVHRLFQDLDVLYSVYDADDPNVRLAMPNKFYEAQIARVPILVAEGTYLAEQTRTAGIGHAVPFQDPTAIAAALEDAFHRQGWYQRAAATLAAATPEALFARHEAAIRRAVLGMERVPA